MDDVSGGANPREDDWWNLAVRVYGLEPVLLGAIWPNSFRSYSALRGPKTCFGVKTVVEAYLQNGRAVLPEPI